MRRLIWIGCAILIAVAGPAIWRVRQGESGICSRTGTALSAAELRRQVIANLVRIEREAVRHRDTEFVRGVAQFRVVDTISDGEIAEAVADSRNGRDAFVQRFAFRNAGPTPDGEGSSLKKEPFVLLTYSLERGAPTRRTASADIRRVASAEVTAGGYRPTLLQKARGFGNHYYQIAARQFTYDYLLPPDAESSPIRALVPIVYRKAGENGGVIANRNRARIVPISNCGDILTYTDDSGFRRIKWTSGEES